MAGSQEVTEVKEIPEVNGEGLEDTQGRMSELFKCGFEYWATDDHENIGFSLEIFT